MLLMVVMLMVVMLMVAMLMVVLIKTIVSVMTATTYSDFGGADTRYEAHENDGEEADGACDDYDFLGHDELQ